MIILQDLAFLVPEESDIKVAAEELAKHLDEPLTKGREHYLISDEPLEFRRHHSVTNVPRCLGRMLWNT